MVGTYTGYAPTVKIGRTEKQKYEEMWNIREYAERSPGAKIAYKFLDVCRPKPGESIMDIGTGSGKAAKVLLDAGLDVTAIDFVNYSMDPWLRDQITFVEHDVTKPFPVRAKWGFCADMLEHIPEQDVPAVLKNIIEASEVAFLQISCVHESWGDLIGEDLHVTVYPHSWWQEKIEALGYKVLWREVDDVHCVFVVVANEWMPAADAFRNLSLNVPESKILENIEANIKGGWDIVLPHIPQPTEVMLLGGGPSLAQFEDEIRQKREAGVPLVTTNGTYHWALERGLKPSAQVMVDARPHNKRFVEPVIDGCKYLIASQCDPSVFEGLPKDRTLMWHTFSTEEGLDHIRKFQKDNVFPIPGGSTVMLRAINLLVILGLYRIHIYGMDSCCEEGKHHAYEQKENDGGIRVKVKTKTKEFECEPWMVSQAIEFQKMAGYMDDSVELAVYGDGLISTIIRESAED